MNKLKFKRFGKLSSAPLPVFLRLPDVPPLTQAKRLVSQKSKPSDFPLAFKLVIGEIAIMQKQIKRLEVQMDKKMHQVTKRMETAQKDVKKGQPKKAIKVLKKAEKKNEKLVKIDKNVRDPIIEKYEKGECKGKPMGKSKKK